MVGPTLLAISNIKVYWNRLPPPAETSVHPLLPTECRSLTTQSWKLSNLTHSHRGLRPICRCAADRGGGPIAPGMRVLQVIGKLQDKGVSGRGTGLHRPKFRTGKRGEESLGCLARLRTAVPPLASSRRGSTFRGDQYRSPQAFRKMHTGRDNFILTTRGSP